MATTDLTVQEWANGPQALTPVEPHWFTPGYADGNGDTVVVDPYTTNYNNGTAPYNVTLTTTDLGGDGAVDGTVPIASYATGYNFHLASNTLANGDKAEFYDVANGAYPQSSAVDIDVQNVDSTGKPVGAPVTLESDVQDVRQFRVGTGALGGNGYVLTWATLDSGAGTETVHYQGFNIDGTPIAGDSGTLDTWNSTGESYGFGSVQTSNQANPSFVYLRGSNDNGAYSNNVGVKYATVSTTGQLTSGLTLIEPPYPAGSSKPDLLNYSYERLTPTGQSQNDLAIIMRYSYVDASGAAHEALDFHAMNAETGKGPHPVVARSAADTDTDLAQTVLANGDVAVGYGDGTDDPYKVQVFDPTGRKVGAPIVLPSDEGGFQLDTNSAGQLVVIWTGAAGSGQQLKYDLYDVGQGAPVTTAGPAAPPSTSGLALNPVAAYDGEGQFTLTGSLGSASATGVEITANVNGTPYDLGAATLNGNGTFTFTDEVGAGVQGFITATETDANGAQTSAQAAYALQGGLNQGAYTASQTGYAADGSAVTAVTRFREDGSRSVKVEASGATYQSSSFDAFLNGGRPDNTFVFNPNHGLDTISLFRVDGVDHDTISLPQSDYTSIADVLNHTTSKGGTSTIADPRTGDTVKLFGVTKAQLQANPGDFTFHA